MAGWLATSAARSKTCPPRISWIRLTLGAILNFLRKYDVLEDCRYDKSQMVFLRSATKVGCLFPLVDPCHLDMVHPLSFHVNVVQEGC